MSTSTTWCSRSAASGERRRCCWRRRRKRSSGQTSAKSPFAAGRARERHPDLQFECLDAWDRASVLALGKPFAKVYVDLSGLSGYNSLLDLLSLLQMYEATLHLEVIVVKSSALKSFAGRCRAWQTPRRRD